MSRRGVLLGFCRVLGVLGRLGHLVVELKKCLTFWMPSPITLSIPDSAGLSRNLACLPSV